MGIFSSKTFNPERDIPDLTGKVALVTGGNAGIGHATAEHLARRGAKVYMAARNKEKAEAAIAKLKEVGLEQVVWLELDLSDPRNAKTAAKEFMSKESRLDILIHNAAVLFEPYEILADGVQRIMVVNLISPFVLTRELVPVLKNTASQPESDVRVVVISSDGHKLVGGKHSFATIEDLNDDCSYSWIPSFARYCMSAARLQPDAYKRDALFTHLLLGLSKLTNVLYASELNRRFSSSADPVEPKIMAISVHPGFVDTFSQKPEISRLHLSPLVGFMVSPFAAAPEHGAYNTVFAATAPVVRKEQEKYGGGYLAPVGRLVRPDGSSWSWLWEKEVTDSKGKEEIEEDRELDERGRELWDTVEKFLKEKGI
ncbi:NAD(P)-binding protein [Pisolithus orientalis]|uniref:NAD(P)-binding protein n=1 Tax=Pisolithus orientalis TaxID=936130 RepID=UPI00222593B9|nr:NAD(P)-binding protein [Pisolithus orientalis]KAI6004396.1 NAD(P)-binding protein [Pisolithus orientalis]